MPSLLRQLGSISFGVGAGALLAVGALASPSQPGTTLHLSIKTQGCPPPPTACSSRRTQVQTVADGVTHYYTPTLDTWGDADVAIPEANTVLSWWVKPEGTLAQRSSQAISCPPCEYPIGFYAVTGDVNDDNGVTILDYNWVRNNLGMGGALRWP